MSNDFLPVRLNTIRADEAVSFDVYVKVGGRYCHYTRARDEMEGQRLKNLRAKGVRKFFIQPKDEDNYLKYLELGLNVLNDQTKDINERGALAHDSLVTSAENAERNLETEQGYDGQKKQFEKITEFLLSDKNALKGMLNSAGISTDVHHHCATVSSLALAVAAKMEITDQKEIFELGIAALLHDIGKNRLKFNSMKPFEEFTADEMRQYKNHPQDGADMLAGKEYISPRILGLISAHEERGVGRGFPNKEDLFKKPLPYQILSMVNQFDHFATEKNILPAKAIDPFFEKFGKDYDENLITVMATVLT